MLRQTLDKLTVRTRTRGFYEVTRDVQSHVAKAAVQTGLCTLHLQHTSASLLIQENVDPAVRADLMAFFARLAPENGRYEHRDEGPDDMPSHIRAAVLPVSLTIPVSGSRPALGTWQGIYLFEHRRMPRRREVAAHLA